MKNPVEEMMQDLQRVIDESGLPLMELSRRSGVAYNTMRAIAAGDGNPTARTLQAVWEAIFARKEEPGKSCLNCAMRGSGQDVNGEFLCELALLSSFDVSPCAAWRKDGD